MKKFTKWLDINYPNFLNEQDVIKPEKASNQEDLEKERRHQEYLEKQVANRAQKISNDINVKGQKGKVFFVNKEYEDYPFNDPIVGTGTQTIKDLYGRKKDFVRNIKVDELTKVNQDAMKGNFKFYIIDSKANTNNTMGTFVIYGAIDKFYCNNRDLVDEKIRYKLIQTLDQMIRSCDRNNIYFDGNLQIQNYRTNKPPYNGNLPFVYIVHIDKENPFRLKAI